MATSTDSIVEGFPHPIIPPIIGIPSYTTISTLNLKLNANAASIQSDLGNGALGLLSLTVSPDVFNTLSDIPFIAPLNPGPQPIIPEAATAAMLSALTRAHTENLRIWREYLATDKGLKQQLINSVDEMYYKTLRNRITGYASVTTRQILEHLYQTYGKISPADLADNDAKMKTAYDPSQPIEALFDQIEEALDLAAAANAAYTSQQIVAYAYNIVFQTGVFADACRDWRRRIIAEKTWANFKTDFAVAHQELRESQLTAQGAGYHAANSVLQETWQAQTADALANLATATASDRSAVSALSSTNSALSASLATANAKLATAQADIVALKTKVTNLQGGQRPRTTTPASTERRYNNTNYCWTHGWDIAINHKSDNCLYKREGHCNDATRENTMGGSDKSKAKVT
jgi:ribosomal protein S17E